MHAFASYYLCVSTLIKITNLLVKLNSTLLCCKLQRGALVRDIKKPQFKYD